MAIPRGYKRNSSGYVVPDKPNVSYGPTAAEREKDPLMDISDLIPGAEGKAPLSARKKYIKTISDSKDKYLAYLKGERESKSAKKMERFKIIQDALNASRNSDPKDALGNRTPSKNTLELEAAAAAALIEFNQQGKKAKPLPGDVQGVPGVRKFDVETDPSVQTLPQKGPVQGAPQTLLHTPGKSQEPGGLMDMEQLRTGGLKPAAQQGQEVLPADAPATTTRGDKVTLKGQQRQGAREMEFLVVTADGKEAWIPRSQFTLDEEAAKGKGRGDINLQRYFEKPVGDFQPF